jgi:hypothetical protein
LQALVARKIALPPRRYYAPDLVNTWLANPKNPIKQGQLQRFDGKRFGNVLGP